MLRRAAISLVAPVARRAASTFPCSGTISSVDAPAAWMWDRPGAALPWPGAPAADAPGLVVPSGSSADLDFIMPPGILDAVPLLAIKRTYQPSNRRRKRKFGFLKRLQDRHGRQIISKRIRRGRKHVSW